MTIEYQVIDLRTELFDQVPTQVRAVTPEKAAELVLGVELVRSGGPRDLRAKVYFQNPGQPVNMVRLYTKASERVSML